MTMVDAAIQYATKYNWSVFPVRQSDKKPLTPHGCKDAKRDVGAITAWWKRFPDASIGIATGSASNLIVIDLDLDENKGLDGYEELARWEHDNDEFPETVRSITGRGGSHIFFHHEGSDIGNRSGILDGIDVRGEGGYIIAPPSKHPNGTEYQWEYAPDETPLAEINATVREFLSIGKKEADEEFIVPALISAGKRNDTLYRLACSLQAKGLPDAAIMAAIKQTNLASCEIPVDDDEIQQIVSSAIRHQKGTLAIVSKDMPEWRAPKISYKIDKDGNVTDKPIQSIENAAEAIEYDKALFGRIRYNEIAYAPYVYGNLPWKPNRGWREWTNNDDANLQRYIENKYGIKDMSRIMTALTSVGGAHSVNPIKDMLEECYERWDGNKHIEYLLPSMLGSEKSEYTAEVMKLFMLGAIRRIYEPGCKFDYMMVLVSSQGTGKSTFLRLLTMNDKWFHDNFNTLDGDKAFEKLRGIWIAELAELQATKRSKDVETIKSFITSRVDTYRAPYERRTEQHPRMSVLAGTSNPVDFLTDRTGNRRFLPVTCGTHEITFDMFADETATKAEMAQAWGEAMDLFYHANKKPSLVIPKRLQDKALEMQTAYLEEDPDIGLIQNYLDTQTDVDCVCAIMLWREALNHEYETPSRRDINSIHEIMKNNVADWHAVGKKRCGDYGVQRCYERSIRFIDTDSSEIPFD